MAAVVAMLVARFDGIFDSKELGHRAENTLNNASGERNEHALRSTAEPILSSHEAESEADTQGGVRNWRQRVMQQGQWDQEADPVSTDGVSALPMPVEIANEESLAPFFAHLRSGGTHTHQGTQEIPSKEGLEPGYQTELIEFPKGVVYSDGRLDLCKMVVGPTHIQALMDNLRSNSFIKHFLLGNNIIGAVGARSIASFVNRVPEQIETWYLAGNCINTASLELLVESWIRSPVITNIWLKRNPLGTNSTQSIASLILQCTSLRTLDLDQTSLGDCGVADLFAALVADQNQMFALPLRHLYLNATGISEQACKQIGLFLASPACALESLYMSCNPIGNAVVHLAAGLKRNKTLQRLALSSCGLNSTSLPSLLEALCGHSAFRTLDLGQAYASEDLNARFNWITDEATPLLVHLVRTTTLQYLELGDVALTQRAVNELTIAVVQSKSALYFNAKSIWRKERAGRKKLDSPLEAACIENLQANVQRDYGCTYDEFLQQHKRFVVSPRDVRLIDSVYRNRDANLARRGLKTLDKHWQAGDDTALRAELGTL